jgi:hypothetical protein
MLYAATQQRPPPIWPRTLWPSRISPVCSSRDSYGIRHNTLDILSFAYSFTNFALTVLWCNLWTFDVKTGQPTTEDSLSLSDQLQKSKKFAKDVTLDNKRHEMTEIY